MKPLRMCLHTAFRRKIISEYPCENIKRLVENPKDIDTFSFEELLAFWGFLDKHYPHWSHIFRVWVRIGLRPGEIYALKWHNVDYFNSKILVRESRTRGVDGSPKTVSSRRDIDMREDVLTELKKQEAISKPAAPEGYVFLNEKHAPIGDEYMRQKFKHLLTRAGIRPRSPMQLRHSFATLQPGAGEQIGWVSRTMGHVNSRMTWEKYNRFVPNLTHDDGTAFEKAPEQESKKVIRIVKGKK